MSKKNDIVYIKKKNTAIENQALNLSTNQILLTIIKVTVFFFI